MNIEGRGMGCTDDSTGKTVPMPSKQLMQMLKKMGNCSQLHKGTSFMLNKSLPPVLMS